MGDHGRPLEATGDHRGKFPRTDFGLVSESGPLPTPTGPLKLRLFGEQKQMMERYLDDFAATWAVCNSWMPGLLGCKKTLGWPGGKKA